MNLMALQTSKTLAETPHLQFLLPTLKPQPTHMDYSYSNFIGGNAATTLPYPLVTAMSGGQHARGKAPDIQEYLALPHGAESFLEAQTANTQIHKKIGDALRKKSTTFNGGKSDEGAWITNIGTVDAFEVIGKAMRRSR